VRSAGAPLHHCREARESASLKNAVLARRAAVLSTIDRVVTSENFSSNPSTDANIHRND
jgi:hypothetical protein